MSGKAGSEKPIVDPHRSLLVYDTFEAYVKEELDAVDGRQYP